MKKYAPPQATGMTFSEAGPVPAQGQIAQQIFWYTAFTAAMTKKGLPVVNEDGTPKWRMAPSPYGPYWKDGMQNGYQDVGSWTFFRATPPDRLAAAWLYAQFVTSKTVSLKKSIVGLTFIRDSDIRHDYFTKNAARYGGLVEFYRSPARVAWTPTGGNVPDYPKLAQLWWKNVATAVTGREDAPGGDGQPGGRDGPGAGPPAARRHEKLLAPAQPPRRARQAPLRRGRPLEKAGQRKTPRPDHPLRKAPAGLERRPRAVMGRDQKTANKPFSLGVLAVFPTTLPGRSGWHLPETFAPRRGAETAGRPRNPAAGTGR